MVSKSGSWSTPPPRARPSLGVSDLLASRSASAASRMQEALGAYHVWLAGRRPTCALLLSYVKLLDERAVPSVEIRWLLVGIRAGGHPVSGTGGVPVRAVGTQVQRFVDRLSRRDAAGSGALVEQVDLVCGDPSLFKPRRKSSEQWGEWLRRNAALFALYVGGGLQAEEIARLTYGDLELRADGGWSVQREEGSGFAVRRTTLELTRELSCLLGCLDSPRRGADSTALAFPHGRSRVYRRVRDTAFMVGLGLHFLKSRLSYGRPRLHGTTS